MKMDGWNELRARVDHAGANVQIVREAFVNQCVRHVVAVIEQSLAQSRDEKLIKRLLVSVRGMTGLDENALAVSDFLSLGKVAIEGGVR